jgi:hypothetical protein
MGFVTSFVKFINKEAKAVDFLTCSTDLRQQTYWRVERHLVSPLFNRAKP